MVQGKIDIVKVNGVYFNPIEIIVNIKKTIYKILWRKMLHIVLNPNGEEEEGIRKGCLFYTFILRETYFWF